MSIVLRRNNRRPSGRTKSQWNGRPSSRSVKTNVIIRLRLSVERRMRLRRLPPSGNNGQSHRLRKDSQATRLPLSDGVRPNSARVNRLMAKRPLHRLSTRNLHLKNKGANSTKSPVRIRAMNSRAEGTNHWNAELAGVARSNPLCRVYRG